MAYVLVKTGPDDLEKVGDELKLKDPSKELDADDVAKPQKLDDIEQNEIEKIIKEIESDPDAEAGFWYKVYQQSGAKKTLLFYHLKTGQIPQKDLGPESDFDDSVRPIQRAMIIQIQILTTRNWTAINLSLKGRSKIRKLSRSMTSCHLH